MRKSKIFFFSISFLLLLSLIPLNFVGVVRAAVQFSSGFETGDLTEWDSSNLTPVVSASYKYSGDYGCQFQSPGNGVGFGDYVTESDFSFSGNDSFTVSFMVYNNVNLPDLDMIVAEGRNQALDKIWDFFLMDSGVARFSNGEGDYFDASYSDQAWFSVSITFYGYDTNMSTTIGGSSGSIPPPSSVSGSLYRLRVGACYVGGQPDSLQKEVWFDDVQVSDIAPSLEVTGEKFNPPDPDFVFVDWKYYDFNLNIPDASLNSTDIDFVFLRFDVPTSEGLIAIAPYYDAGAGAWGLISNLSDPDRFGEPVIFTSGSIQSYGSGASAGDIYVFELWFEDKVLDVWDPLDCIDVDVAWNETDGYSESWISFSEVFRIYNDGGFPDDVEITGPGSSGVLPGGRDLSMFAYNNSYVYKEVVWRDAVHIKLMPITYFRAGQSSWDQIYQLDYMLEDGEQHQGLQMKICADEVSYTGVFAGNVWINMTISWLGSDGVLIKEDPLYMFYHGTIYNPPDPGRWKFWIDLWFDNTNASTVIGGRINAYEYPMEDSSAAWYRWLSSNWGIKDDVNKQSECFTTILDHTDTAAINSERIKFVVLVSSLDVPGMDGSDQFIAISDFGVYDVTLAQQLPMRGISSPPWDETQLPGVGNSGVLGAVYSMFSGLGGWLSETLGFGGLNLWGNFVAFLDNIAAMFGAPTFFTDLFGWITSGLTYLADSLGYAFSVISNIFSMIGAVIVDFLVIISEAIVSFVVTLGMVGDFLGGGIAGASNVWNDLGLSTWITVVLIFYPLYLILLWEKEGIEPVIQQLTWIFGILVWLGAFFISIAQFVIGLITSLIESIPVAE